MFEDKVFMIYHLSKFWFSWQITVFFHLILLSCRLKFSRSVNLPTKSWKFYLFEDNLLYNILIQVRKPSVIAPMWKYLVLSERATRFHVRVHVYKSMNYIVYISRVWWGVHIFMKVQHEWKVWEHCVTPVNCKWYSVKERWICYFFLSTFISLNT